jgi:hypothetical protein
MMRSTAGRLSSSSIGERIGKCEARRAGITTALS